MLIASKLTGLAAIASMLLPFSWMAVQAQSPKVSELLDRRMNNIQGKEVYLGDYQGSVLLIVNVASKCGLTPQYEALESLYRKYRDKGLRILAFPANNFLWQEPGTNEEIQTFCKTKYDVTFDLFAKISVKGDDQCDLYKFLTDETKNAPYGGPIKWNFAKFLVGRKGQVIARFDPSAKPDSPEVEQAIAKALEEKAE